MKKKLMERTSWREIVGKFLMKKLKGEKKFYYRKYHRFILHRLSISLDIHSFDVLLLNIPVGISLDILLYVPMLIFAVPTLPNRSVAQQNWLLY